MTIQDKVTKQELRDLSIGQTRIFILRDKSKLESARVTCCHLKNIEGLEFSTKIDFDASAISITRIR